jgi:NADP-dependent 3-hydroxy acid dehydrogenase YdfG
VRGTLAPGIVVVMNVNTTKEPAMRVFVAGATGAIGRQLVPRLVAAGHEVHGVI